MKDEKDEKKIGEAYSNEAKAPRRGVKADDADEYSDKSGVDGWDKGVESHGAYRSQAKAPTGRGSSGSHGSPSPKPISGFDQAVSKGGAYAAQNKADHVHEEPSLGFQPAKEGLEYMGHFAQEKFLRQGHNDGPSMEMDGFDGPDMGQVNGGEQAPSQSAAMLKKNPRTSSSKINTAGHTKRRSLR